MHQYNDGIVRYRCLFILFNFIFRIFSGRFDTSGSMIARSVPEIHCTRKTRDRGGGGQRTYVSLSVKYPLFYTFPNRGFIKLLVKVGYLDQRPQLLMLPCVREVKNCGFQDLDKDLFQKTNGMRGHS